MADEAVGGTDSCRFRAAGEDQAQTSRELRGAQHQPVQGHDADQGHPVKQK
jgi:hypothetical protein